MSKPQFKPTAEQIKAAQLVFIAYAFHKMVKEHFDFYEAEIISSGEYHIDDEYYQSDKWKRHEFPEDRIIRHKRELCHMAGLKLYDKEGYEQTDCARFYEALRKRAMDAGYIHGENAECRASNDVIKLENEFITATSTIHRLNVEDIVMMDHRKKLIDLTLGLFAPIVNNTSFDSLKRKYFDERVRELVTG